MHTFLKINTPILFSGFCFILAYGNKLLQGKFSGLAGKIPKKFTLIQNAASDQTRTQHKHSSLHDSLIFRQQFSSGISHV